MTISATHTGTCQLCGRRHMLPGGKLAKHGYTLDYGFFSGTCRGSDELPFEQGKSLAEKSLAQAAARRDELLAQADAVSLTGNDDGTVWAYVRRKARDGKSYRTWEKATLTANCRLYTTTDGLSHQTGYYGDANDVVRQMQTAYALHFRVAAKQADDYIDWQAARCASWAPAPLQLVEDEKAKKTHVIRYRDGSGYVADVYGKGWGGVSATKTTDAAKAARYTERGAKQAIGRLRGWNKMEEVAL